MAGSISARYDRLAEGFARRVDAVPAERWSSPSPCEGWTACDVVGHVVETHGMFLGFIGRSLPDRLPNVDDDPAAAFDGARRQMQACLDDPEIADTEYHGAFGTSNLAQGVDGFLCFDLNVHGWDLARACGLDERMDPAEVERLQREALAFDAMRGPGTFGPELPPPEGADAQARLLAFLGRDPT